MKHKSISNCTYINSSDFLITYEWIIKNILSKYVKSTNDIKLIGSAFKKEIYGDIDIAIKISSLNISIDELYQKLSKLYECKFFKGFNQISIGIPIVSYPFMTKGNVQVDFMFVNNLEWSSFIYYSPNFLNKESNFKGLYNLSLLNAIFSESLKKEIIQDNKVIAYDQYVCRPYAGIYKICKTYKGKYDLLKTPKIINDTFITSDPQEAINLMFKNLSYKQFTSFENIWKLLHSSNFLYPQKRTEIITKYIHYLTQSKNKIPNVVTRKYATTVLIPGGFKPLTGGHIHMINQYFNHPLVKKIILFIGPKQRDGITQDKSIQICKLLLNNYNIEIIKSNNPVKDVFDYINNVKRGVYTMGSSSKSYSDIEKVYRFINNYKINGKFYDNINNNVTTIDLKISTNPINYQNRTDKLNNKPISASILRNDIKINNFENFSSNYPQLNINEIKKIWTILQSGCLLRVKLR